MTVMEFEVQYKINTHDPYLQKYLKKKLMGAEGGQEAEFFLIIPIIKYKKKDRKITIGQTAQ